MKKIIIVLIAGIIFLNLNSCAAENQEYSYSIKDALKISAWVVDENIDEDGYWTEDEYYVYHGYWTEKSTERIINSHEEDIFVLEQLKLNEVRTMVPMGHLMSNLNIYCKFDGMIEVETDDEYIRLTNVSNPYDTCMEYKSIKWPLELCANICPLDKYYAPGVTMIMLGDTEVGREYYVNVNAYKYENDVDSSIIESKILIPKREQSPIIRAKLKLVVLEDKAPPNSEDFRRLNKKGRSRFLSIELISYEYSDVYIILDELWDVEDD